MVIPADYKCSKVNFDSATSVKNLRRADMIMSDSESAEEELEDIMMMMQFILRRNSIRGRKKKRRSIWVRALFQKRNEHGYYHKLQQEKE